MRNDRRKNDEMRLVRVTNDFIKYPEGSILMEFGETKVICNATVQTGVPAFLDESLSGWLTAEYAMLPRATHTRSMREAAKGSFSGRTHEISRLIGRALRGVVDLSKIPGKTIFIDCDVIQADGGTRVTSITGAFIAVAIACKKLLSAKEIATYPVKDYLAAISCGIVNGEALLDLNYEEDSSASVDLNLIATGSGKIVEIQCTAEKEPFDNEGLQEMLRIGFCGINRLIDLEKRMV
jgi:ribonuclease PH